MTRRTWEAMLSRSALAGLAAISLVACGPREPTTDAERLARGRELVQQVSARLAAATELSATTTEVRDVSGVLILAMRPFEIGDQIVIDHTEGTVEQSSCVRPVARLKRTAAWKTS